MTHFTAESRGRGGVAACRVRRSDSPVTGAAAGANLAGMLRILEASLARCSQRRGLGRAWSSSTSCSATSLRFFVGQILGRGFGPSTVRSGSSSPACGNGGRIRWRSCDLPVIAWHRRGFARFWARKSPRVGRPPVSGRARANRQRWWPPPPWKPPKPRKPPTLAAPATCAPPP